MVKARILKVKTFSEAIANIADLDTAYETWRADRTEEVIREVRFALSETHVAMQVYYTEG